MLEILLEYRQAGEVCPFWNMLWNIEGVSSFRRRNTESRGSRVSQATNLSEVESFSSQLPISPSEVESRTNTGTEHRSSRFGLARARPPPHAAPRTAPRRAARTGAHRRPLPLRVAALQRRRHTPMNPIVSLAKGIRWNGVLILLEYVLEYRGPSWNTLKRK